MAIASQARAGVLGVPFNEPLTPLAGEVTLEERRTRTEIKDLPDKTFHLSVLKGGVRIPLSEAWRPRRLHASAMRSTISFKPSKKDRAVLLADGGRRWNETEATDVVIVKTQHELLVCKSARLKSIIEQYESGNSESNITEDRSETLTPFSGQRSTP